MRVYCSLMQNNASAHVAIVLLLALTAALPLKDASARSTKPKRPEQISTGQASVIDGDTLELHGMRIRLAVVDAPEARQNCRRDRTLWPCGRRAAFALADLIGDRPVTCRWRTKDRYGRPVARCTAGSIDLGGWLVENGWALAYRRYGVDYVSQEETARAARRGMWAGSFVPPWDFRARRTDEVSARSYVGA